MLTQANHINRDRLPYLTTVRDGTPSTVPEVNDVHHNFIVANFAADGGCLDNDDGSSYYDIRDNVCFFGGHKQNFDGHSKRGFRNLYIHPSVYGVKCIDEETEGESTGTSGPHGLPKKGYAVLNHISTLSVVYKSRCSSNTGTRNNISTTFVFFPTRVILISVEVVILGTYKIFKTV